MSIYRRFNITFDQKFLTLVQVSSPHAQSFLVICTFTLVQMISPLALLHFWWKVWSLASKVPIFGSWLIFDQLRKCPKMKQKGQIGFFSGHIVATFLEIHALMKSKRRNAWVKKTWRRVKWSQQTLFGFPIKGRFKSNTLISGRIG